MEVPSILFSQKTHTPNQNGIYSQRKIILTEKVTPFLDKTNTMKKNVKIIYCDGVGENKTLEENCAEKSKEINFGFMSPGTPQQNGVLERGFATPYSCIYAQMGHARLP